jgi:hypothetical protein
MALRVSDAGTLRYAITSSGGGGGGEQQINAAPS